MRFLIAIICTALSCRAAQAASESQSNILVAGFIGVPGGLASIARFDHEGEFRGTFGADGGVYFSIAAFGDTIYVSEREDFIKRFSREGDFLGYLGAGLGGDVKLETDSRGAVYVPVYRGALQLNPDGTIIREFTEGPLAARAADADLAGNVYIEGYALPSGSGMTGMYKYTSAGNMLGFVPHAASRPSTSADMAIDEIGEVMYLTDGKGALEAYDISGALPVLSHVVPTPGPIFGLSFDAASRHLFVTEGFGLRVWELDLYGTPLRRFRVNADEGSFTHMDVAVIAVPEPLAATVVAPVLLVLHACRRRLRWSAAR